MFVAAACGASRTTPARRRSSAAALLVLLPYQVTTPYDDVLLAEPDLSVMADFHKDCCEAGNATSSFCTEVCVYT